MTQQSSATLKKLREQDEQNFIEKRKTEVAQIMAEFLAACPRFVQSVKHWDFLYYKLEQSKRSLTVENLVRTANELYRLGYHALVTPTAEEAAAIQRREEEQIRQQKVAEALAQYNTPEAAAARARQAAKDAAAAEKALFASWWVPRPGENSLQTWQRANGLKEEYFRKKYPRAVPNPNAVHPDTIRNTNQAIAMEKVRAERQQQSRVTPPIQPRGEHAQLPFIHAEEARARTEAAATTQAAADRDKK